MTNLPQLTDGYVGDSDANASSQCAQWSLGSVRSIKEEGETFSEYYGRIGVFAGVGVYCWHRAVDDGAHMCYRLNIVGGADDPDSEKALYESLQFTPDGERIVVTAPGVTTEASAESLEDTAVANAEHLKVTPARSEK